MDEGSGSRTCLRATSFGPRGGFQQFIDRPETTYAFGQSGRRLPGCIAARRADKPPGHRLDSVARNVFGWLLRDADLHHARSRVLDQNRQSDPRDRSGQTLRLGMRLRDVSQTQRTGVVGAGKTRCTVRQKARDRRGLDSHRDQSASNAQRRPSQAARGDAQRARRAPSKVRFDGTGDRFGRPKRHAGLRSTRSLVRIRRSNDGQVSGLDHHAG